MFPYGIFGDRAFSATGHDHNHQGAVDMQVSVPSAGLNSSIWGNPATVALVSGGTYGNNSRRFESDASPMTANRGYTAGGDTSSDDNRGGPCSSHGDAEVYSDLGSEDAGSSGYSEGDTGEEEDEEGDANYDDDAGDSDDFIDATSSVSRSSDDSDDACGDHSEDTASQSDDGGTV